MDLRAQREELVTAMLDGVAQLPEHRGNYWQIQEGEVTGACAIGAAAYSMGCQGHEVEQRYGDVLLRYFNYWGSSLHFDNDTLSRGEALRRLKDLPL